MRHPEYLMIVLVLIAIIYFLYATKSSTIIKKKIRQHPFKNMKEVKDGEVVRIKGKVVLVGKTLRAPLSNRVCVYYFVQVKDSSNRKELFKNYIELYETRVADIVLFDGSHYALISKDNLQAHVLRDHSQTSSFWFSTSEELKAFLKRKKERTEDYLGWSLDLYAEEGVLEAGETVEVLGTATWKSTRLFKGLKIPAEEVLHVVPLAEDGLYLTDETLY